MASQSNTLPRLLSSLLSSLEAATDSVPEPDRLEPPTDAQSLLTTKNDLFLAYIQNLVFLIIIKLRHYDSSNVSAKEAESFVKLHEEVVEKLVELRHYLEKGVKPLESKMTYQIDLVIRAAEKASRLDRANGNPSKREKAKTQSETKNETRKATSDDESTSESGSASDSSSEDDEETSHSIYRPARLTQASRDDARTSSDRPGIYKAPRTHPTAYPLPTTDPDHPQKARSRPSKPSSTLDEFVRTELTGAPLNEPSIGSTIRDGGRRNMTHRERQTDDDKRRYEEDNFVRLAPPSKKELRRTGGGSRKGTYGGEEWGDLNGAVDRISGMTRKRDAGRQLERSRKRVVDFGGAGGIGERFDKRRKM